MKGAFILLVTYIINDENKEKLSPNAEVPTISIDSVLFCYDKENDDLKVLFIKRKNPPFQNSWALPGGFVKKGEAAADSCIRQTKEATGISITHKNIEQLHTFTQPNRDPRGWVITISYLSFIGESPLKLGENVADAEWFSLSRKEETIELLNHQQQFIRLDLKDRNSTGNTSLAFDHKDIVIRAFERVANKMYHEPQILRVLGPSFTITEARKVFAKFLGTDYKAIDHSNFKKALRPFLREIGERSIGVGRPSKLFELIESK